MDEFVLLSNELASKWAGIMWPAVWQSTVLGLTLLFASKCLRGAPATLRCWLWMLIPLRLLAMPLLSISLPVLPALPPANLGEAAEYRVSAPASHTEPQEIASYTPTPSGELISAFPQGEGAPAPPVAVRGERLGWVFYLMAAWVLGVLVAGVRMLRGWSWMRRIVSEGRTVTDGPLVDGAIRMGAMFGLRSLPQLIITSAPVSPFTGGLFRPVVVFPEALIRQISAPQLSAVLAHEFAHLRRRDPMYGLVLGVCEALYFFHPVVHLVRQRIFFERERACDALVLEKSQARPGAYARALYAAAQVAQGARHPAHSPILVAESFHELEQRLAALGAGIRPRARLTRGSIAFLALLGVLCVPQIALTRAEHVEARTAQLVPGRGAQDRELASPPDVGVSKVALDERVQGAAPEGTPMATAATRILHFPKDRSMGTLHVRRGPLQRRYRLGPNYSNMPERDFVADAQGDVEVPADMALTLIVAMEGGRPNLMPLRALAPDDLYGVSIYQPEEMRIDANTTVMPHIGALTGLKELELTLPELDDRGFAHLAKLSELQVLDVVTRGGAGVSDAGLAVLESLKSLEVLRLWSGMTDRALAHVGTLSSLRELSISGNNLSGAGIASLAPLAHLEFLRIEGGNFGDGALRDLHVIPGLRSLHLFSELATVSDAGMLHVGRIATLEELRFSWLRGVTARGLAHLKPLSKLQLIDVHRAPIGDAGLAVLGGLRSLNEIWINDEQALITDVGISSLQNLPKLERLYLMGARQLTAAGLQHLGEIHSLRKLWLLGGPYMDDNGVEQLAGLRRLQELSIDVKTKKATDRTLQVLGGISELRRLEVRFGTLGTPFSVTGVNQLNRLTHLRSLDVWGVKHDGAVLDLSGLKELEDISILLDTFHDDDLLSLGRLTKLQRLRVDGVSDRGLEHLKGLRELRVLSAGPDLTDTGLRYLQPMQYLTELSIGGQFSVEGLATLPPVDRLTITNYTPLTRGEQDRVKRSLVHVGNVKFQDPAATQEKAFGAGQ